MELDSNGIFPGDEGIRFNVEGVKGPLITITGGITPVIDHQSAWKAVTQDFLTVDVDNGAVVHMHLENKMVDKFRIRDINRFPEIGGGIFA